MACALIVMRDWGKIRRALYANRQYWALSGLFRSLEIYAFDFCYDLLF